MPKKTRKAKERASRRPISRGYVPPVIEEPEDQTVTPTGRTLTVPPPTSPAASVRGSIASTRAAPTVPTNYSYVYADLKRIAILAALFFAIMLALWFILPSLPLGI